MIDVGFLKGLLTYVADGNVVEVRECGFVDELIAKIAELEGDGEPNAAGSGAHTPGPWEILDAYDADLLNENPPRREEVWEIGNRDAGNSPAYATSEADARLIAAAPQLLEMLQEADRVIRWAAQESTGRVKSEIVGGWLYHADKIRAVITALQ